MSLSVSGHAGRSAVPHCHGGTHSATATAQPIGLSLRGTASKGAPPAVHSSPSGSVASLGHRGPPKAGDLPTTTRFAQIRGEFMDSVTNAILRCLDKHPESTKTEAENAVFEAMGYDRSDEPLFSEKAAFTDDINHFRVHHIMRSRDAIRTLRIKAVFNGVAEQFPSYSPQDVLLHLTEILNALFLPSPPPPVPVESECLESSTRSVDEHDVRSRESNPALLRDQCAGRPLHELRSASPLTPTGRAIGDGLKKRESAQGVQQMEALQRLSADKRIGSGSENATSKRVAARDSEGERGHSVHSAPSRKAAPRKKSGSTNTVGAVTVEHILSNFVDTISPRSLRQQYFVRSTRDGLEDEVDKKFKLHSQSRKSRKRKFAQSMASGVVPLDGGCAAAMGAEGGGPPSKRHRGHGVHLKGRKRAKRGRKRTAAKYHQNVRRRNTNSDNYSTDHVFDDEEDDGSDLDLGVAPIMHSTTTNSLRR